MDILHAIIQNSQLPFVTAFVLSLMTSVSPCPLATNITAIAYIGQDIEDRRKVFFNGLVYTLGRAISYSVLGLLFYFGASQFRLSWFFQHWGERILGPLLLIAGLFMLDIIKIRFPGLGKLSEKMEKTGRFGFWGILLMGVVFALAFCPYSGALYFGMLIPMTLSSVSGLYLPVVFALGTGIPVLIFAWIVAYTMGNVGKIYKKVKSFELWARRVVALIFIIVGIYYIGIFFV